MSVLWKVAILAVAAIVAGTTKAKAALSPTIGTGLIRFDGKGPEWWRWQYVSARRGWKHARARWGGRREYGVGQIAVEGRGAEWWHARFVSLVERRRRRLSIVSGFGRRVVRYAFWFRGVPYLWGGTTPAGFDCSGFVQYVFRAFGVGLPRTTWGQLATGRAVAAGNLRPGDAVFTYGGEHVGIYVGGGSFVDANHPGGSVGVRSLSFYPGYAGARRYR